MKFGRKFEFVILLLVALGAGPAGAAIWNWSTTAGNNANADPTINWAEGMSPSSVNDSARAMMASLASWRNDISGVNTTAGGPTAYTLTTSEGVNTTPAAGQMVAFYINATNGNSPTLAVDGGNVYPLFLNNVAVPAGSLVAGTPYRVSYDNAGHWQLESGYSSPYSVPLGGLLPSTLSAPPNSSFIYPIGQCISNTTYAAYWNALGNPASGSCPGGQFAVIDMRGRVPAMVDGLTGFFAGAGRLTSASYGCGTALNLPGQVCANGLEYHALSIAEMPQHSHPNFLTDPGHIHQTSVPTRLQTVSFSGPGPIVGIQANNGSDGQFFATTAFTGISLTNGFAGGSAAHPIVQPTMGLNYFLRVL